MHASNAARVGLLSLVILVSIGPALNMLAPAPCPGGGVDPEAIVPAWVGSVGVAQAIPSFTRKFNVPCQTCHLAPPYLNAFGRKFMETGYRMPDEEGVIDEEMQNHQHVNDNLTLEKMLPLAMRLASVPVSASTSEPAQFQPFAGYDLIAFGNFFRIGSFHFAMGGGAEDDFVPAGDGRMGIHPSPYLNVVAGFGGPFSADPYNTFRTDDIGLTRTVKAPLADGHTGGLAFADDMQFLEAYGRAGMFFYSAGILGEPNAVTGNTPQLGMARLAVDPMENLSFGAFGLGGRRPKNDEAGVAADATVWRAGVDADATFADVTGVAAFLVAGDQLDEGTEQVNLGGFVEGLYTLRLEGRPILMPLARLDWVQEEGANVLQGTLDVSTWVFENTRVGMEGSYQSTIGQDDGDLVGSLFADVVF